MRWVLMLGLFGGLAWSGCSEDLGLDDQIFACGPALPCTPGFVCEVRPAYDGKICVPEGSSPPEKDTHEPDLPLLHDGDDDAPDTETLGDASVDTGQDIGSDSTPSDTLNDVEDVPDLPDVPGDADANNEELPLQDSADAGPAVDTSEGDDGIGSDVDVVTPCDPADTPLCFSECEGFSAYQFPDYVIPPKAMFVDMSGDAEMEIIAYGHKGFAILTSQGDVLHEELAADNAFTYARGSPVAVEARSWWFKGPLVKPMDVFAAPGKKATLYGKQSEQALVIEVTLGPSDVYDFNKFMARDLDWDGVPEFVAGQGCDPLVVILNLDEGDEELSVPAIAQIGDLSCAYTDGRLITDLDGDGVHELIVGTGMANAQKVGFWNGDIRTYAFDLVTGQLKAVCEKCFPTQIDGLFKSGVTDLVRIGAVIHAIVRYFETDQPPAEGSVYYHWQYDLKGGPLGDPSETDKNTFEPPVSLIDNEPVAGGGESVRQIGLWDVDLDGYADRLWTDGADVTLELFNEKTNAFEEVKSARKTLGVDNKNVTLRAVWDRDGDGALDLILTDKSGRFLCLEMGAATFNRTTSIPPLESPYYRTYQWDNYEPNDGQDIDDDGFPDRVVQLSSNLTTFGRAWSYIQDSDDVDFFEVSVTEKSSICLHHAKDVSYSLTLYSDLDFMIPAGPDGPIWFDESPDKTIKCVQPYTNEKTKGYMGQVDEVGVMPMTIRVTSIDGTASFVRPYWIETPGIPSNPVLAP